MTSPEVIVNFDNKFLCSDSKFSLKPLSIEPKAFGGVKRFDISEASN